MIKAISLRSVASIRTAQLEPGLLAHIGSFRTTRKSCPTHRIWRFRTIQLPEPTLSGSATSAWGLAISDPGKSGAAGRRMQHPRMGGAKATSRRLFLWPKREPSPLAAAARQNHEHRAGPQGRRVILRPQKRGRPKPPAISLRCQRLLVRDLGFVPCGNRKLVRDPPRRAETKCRLARRPSGPIAARRTTRCPWPAQVPRRCAVSAASTSDNRRALGEAAGGAACVRRCA